MGQLTNQLTATLMTQAMAASSMSRAGLNLMGGFEKEEEKNKNAEAEAEKQKNLNEYRQKRLEIEQAEHERKMNKDAIWSENKTAQTKLIKAQASDVNAEAAGKRLQNRLTKQQIDEAARIKSIDEIKAREENIKIQQRTHEEFRKKFLEGVYIK